MRTAPRHAPQTHAQNRASARALRLVGSETIRGSARPRAAMPCSARFDVTGLSSFAYSDSTAWAIAFIPETRDIAGGRPYVSSTSYTITSGRTFIERI